MKLSVRNFPFVFFAGFTLIILLSLLVISTSEFLREPEIFAFALTADITLGIPLLFYFFVIRKYDLSLIFAVPVVIFSVVLANVLIPGTHHYYLDFMKQGLVIGELILIIFGAVKIYKIVNEFKKIKTLNFDLIEKLVQTFNNIFGRSGINEILVSEISMLYYSLFFWKAEKEYSAQLPYFTYHKKSSYLQFWCVILFVLVLETFAIHALLVNWNTVLTYIFLGISFYTFLFLIADLTSVLKRPVVISEGNLYLRTGLRWRAEIPLNKIESFEEYKAKTKDKGILNISLIGESNVVIIFNDAVEFKGIYGIRKNVNKILLFIDDIKGFRELIMKNK
jgi:hypothetical protein